MKLLNVSNDVLQYYREKVRGNENITLDQARKKLTRNVMLAKKVTPRKRLDRLLGISLYQYGNLHMKLRWNKIIYIKNHRSGKHYGNWKLDKEKYIRLSEELGIEEVKFKNG